MPEAKITIVIVCYNSAKTLTTCMSELLESAKFPITIVDNASTDDSVRAVKENYPLVTVIESPENLGYGRAANLAFTKLETPYGLLVNPDLKLSTKDVERLINTAEKLNNSFTLLAPAVRKKDHRCKGLIEEKWVIGAAMLFHAGNMKSIGWFDENIFLFSEETDLCKRIKNEDKKIFVDTNHYIEHLSKQSSPPSDMIENLKNWHSGWSNAYFHRKHGLNKGRKAEWRVLLRYFIKSKLNLNTKKRKSYAARFQGCLSFVRGEKAFDKFGKPKHLQ